MTSSTFEPADGHKYFSADFFNRVWDFLGKEKRTPKEDQQMLSMCHASIAHWRDREDCGAQQLSIGYWQLSRVYAVLEKGIPANSYGELCLEASAGEGAFYLGFALETICRAEKLLGNTDAASAQLAAAREQLALVGNEDERKMLAADLDSLDR